jgi:hypothetical protein
MDVKTSIIGLVLAAVLGMIPATIAKRKGWSFVGWWCYGFLIWIVALPHALLLKRKNLSDIDRTEAEKRIARAELAMTRTFRRFAPRGIVVPFGSPWRIRELVFVLAVHTEKERTQLEKDESLRSALKSDLLTVGYTHTQSEVIRIQFKSEERDGVFTFLDR